MLAVKNILLLISIFLHTSFGYGQVMKIFLKLDTIAYQGEYVSSGFSGRYQFVNLRDSAVLKIGISHGAGDMGTANYDPYYEFKNPIVDGIYEVFINGILVDKCTYNNNQQNGFSAKFSDDGQTFIYNMQNNVPKEFIHVVSGELYQYAKLHNRNFDHVSFIFTKDNELAGIRYKDEGGEETITDHFKKGKFKQTRQTRYSSRRPVFRSGIKEGEKLEGHMMIGFKNQKYSVYFTAGHVSRWELFDANGKTILADTVGSKSVALREAELKAFIQVSR